MNFNFIGTNRYISISIYIDQYQRWTRARGKGKAREKIAKISSFALAVSLYAPTSGRAPALIKATGDESDEVWFLNQTNLVPRASALIALRSPGIIQTGTP